VDGGRGGLDEFEAPRNGEFYDFVEFVTGGKFGRVRGSVGAGFKLQIADGGKSGGIAHRGAGGIRFGLVPLFVLLRSGLRGGRLRLAGRWPSGDGRKKRTDRGKARATERSPKTNSLPEWTSEPHRIDVISYSLIPRTHNGRPHRVPTSNEGEHSLPCQPPFIEIHWQEIFDVLSGYLASWLHL
jgi:hypothetical protein